MKLKLILALMLICQMAFAQKTWEYQDQKHAKGSISGKFICLGDKKWIEKNNIEGPFNFENVQVTKTEIVLVDKRRNVYVKLTNAEMLASWGNPNSWQKYYDGRWQEWTYENQNHAKGEISGKFIYLGDKSWIERNNIEGPFNFEEVKADKSEVVLLDKKRNVFVKLTENEMSASWNNPDSFEKYYDGAWK